MNLLIHIFEAKLLELFAHIPVLTFWISDDYTTIKSQNEKVRIRDAIRTNFFRSILILSFFVLGTDELRQHRHPEVDGTHSEDENHTEQRPDPIAWL
jgi:hypothetical protein